MLIRRQKGVSLIEVLIGIALLAVLMGLGMPQYATFLANARLRAAAEGISTGLSLARAEAVKRNARVEMVLTNEEPIEALVNAVPQQTDGMNWMVREFVPRTGAYNFIEGKVGAEGGGRQTGTSVQVASSSPGVNAGNATPPIVDVYTGMASFSGFGALIGGSPITYQITNPSGGLCAAAGGPMRCLTVVVSSGGQIRTCDPAVNPVTNPTDTRAC